MVIEVRNHMETSNVENRLTLKEKVLVSRNIDSPLEHSNSTIEMFLDQNAGKEIEAIIPSIEVSPPTQAERSQSEDGGQSELVIEMQNHNFLTTNPEAYEQDFTFEKKLFDDACESDEDAECKVIF